MTTNEDGKAQPDPDTRELIDHNQSKIPRPIIKIDPDNVPPELHFLIPYAEKWGINDFNTQKQLLDKASTAELEELSNVVRPVLNDIDKASYFPPMEGTPEAIILHALTRASSRASTALREMRWRNERLEEMKSSASEVVMAAVSTVAERKAQLVLAGWPDNYPNPRMNPANVPHELHPLIPYAEKWGIPDRKLQEALLHEAPLAEIEELSQIMYPLWDDIERFRTSRPSSEEPRNYEVGIFAAFREVFGEAFSILGDERPERLLEIIGWPEACPSFPIDPIKFPPELQPLVPYAKKWVIEDEGVRDTVFKLATNEELEELIAAVKQIGIDKIRYSATKISYDETRETEGYALLLLMNMVEEAEFDLRHRRNVTPPDEIVPE